MYSNAQYSKIKFFYKPILIRFFDLWKKQLLMWLFLRSLLWVIICPGTVTMLLPWIILSRMDSGIQQWSRFQWSGMLLIGVGSSILFWCIYAFARQGKGTLSPVDPAKRLVISGLYRYTRNPMYVGVTVVLLGETLFFGSIPLLFYTGLVFLGFNLFIRLYEEPYLGKQFGDEYEQYCKQVGRWLPGRPYQL